MLAVPAAVVTCKTSELRHSAMSDCNTLWQSCPLCGSDIQTEDTYWCQNCGTLDNTNLLSEDE